MPHPLFKYKYLVSNKGDVLNVRTGTMREQSISNGYCRIPMYHNKKPYTFAIHRMVALAFIKNPNPINKPCVNHLDGNKLNNVYWNLEWASDTENSQHAVDTGLMKITKRRVGQYDLDENLIKIFESQAAAAIETGLKRQSINRVCKGGRKSTGGFIFKNMDIDVNEQDEVCLDNYKQIKQYPNYWIDCDGNVFSTKTKKFRRTKLRSNIVIIQLTKPDPAGGQIIIEIPIRNLVAKYFLEKPNGQVNFIKHKDGDRQNNRFDNLEWSYMPSLKRIVEV